MRTLQISNEKLILGEERDFQTFKNELIEGIIQGIKPLLSNTVNLKSESEWVDGTEAKQILGYRSKTKMQKMRDTKTIVFSKFGRKIKYQKQSLIDYIEGNKIS